MSSNQLDISICQKIDNKLTSIEKEDLIEDNPGFNIGLGKDFVYIHAYIADDDYRSNAYDHIMGVKNLTGIWKNLERDIDEIFEIWPSLKPVGERKMVMEMYYNGADNMLSSMNFDDI